MGSANSQWVSDYRENARMFLSILKELRELKQEAVSLDLVNTLTDEECCTDTFPVTVQNMVDAVLTIDAVEAALQDGNKIANLYRIARRN